MTTPEPPRKKSPVRVLIETLGDAVILAIRVWRLARNPRRRSALVRYAKKNHRARQLARYYEVLRRRVLHPLDTRWRLLRRRISHFHRVTSVPRLRLLYAGSMAGIVLVVSLLTYFLTPKAPPENPRRDVVIARLMEDTANLIAAKRLRKAERNIAELKVLLPDNSTVHTFAGAAKSLEKDYAGARAEYARALELNPSSFNAAFNLAEVDFVTKNYPRAEVQFREMLEDRPGNEILLFRLFLCALLQKHAVQADELLALLPSVGATPAWYYANAARLFADKKGSEARKIIATARILYPDKTAFFDATLQVLDLR